MSERFRRIGDLFDAAAELGPGRGDYLLAACADPGERAEVEALLAAHDTAPAFLDGAALDALGAEEAPGSLVGSRAGAYEIVAYAGEGGMASVYRGRRADDAFSRDVAVKVVKRGTETDEVLARFRSERRVLAALRHGNIVTLLDAGALPDGRPYIVMDWVDGVPIDRYCAEKSLPVRERARLFLDVCAAVHHAHQRLVLHRDLKPANILVTADGTPTLLDFGVAKLLERDGDAGGAESLTRPGARAPMTLAFASPEQVRGGPITTASDVYSLGCVLHAMLAGGGHPYGAASGTDLERAILEADPKPAGTGDDLDTIVRHALRKEPERRYASAERLADDVQRYLDGRPVLARRDSRLYRAARFVRRNPWPVVAAAALAASGVFAILSLRAGVERARAGESVAWRAHAAAVAVGEKLEEALERLVAGESGDPGALLDEWERSIPARFGALPEAEARLRLALARAHLRLARPADAERNACAALELARSTPGLGPDDRLAALAAVGDARLALGDAAAAVEAAREAVAFVLERRGADHSSHRPAVERLARALRAAGRDAEAAALDAR